MSDQYILSQEVWDQASANYDAQRRLRTKIVSGDFTIKDALEWGTYQGLGCGNVVITKPDEQK